MRWWYDNSRRTNIVAAAAAVLFTLCLACHAQGPGQPKSVTAADQQRSVRVLTIQRQVSLKTPTDVSYTAGRLVDEPFSPRPRASLPPSPAGVLRFLGSAAQNSRLPATLKPGK